MWSNRALGRPVLKKLESLIASRAYIYDVDKRRLVPQFQIDLDSPWAHFGISVNCRNCHLWTKIMFRHFDLVPSFCRFNCHKIVAKPQSVMELIQTYHFANSIPFLSGGGVLTIPIGKAGVDRRTYTDSPYTVFWYANNGPHAQKIYTLVGELLVDNGFSSLAKNLIIKKSCTEMEAMKGPTNGDFWKTMNEEERLLEDQLGDIFLCEPDDNGSLPNWHLNGVIESWLDFARTHGDTSGDEFFGIHGVRAITYNERKEV